MKHKLTFTFYLLDTCMLIRFCYVCTLDDGFHGRVEGSLLINRDSFVLSKSSLIICFLKYSGRVFGTFSCKFYYRRLYQYWLLFTDISGDFDMLSD